MDETLSSATSPNRNTSPLKLFPRTIQDGDLEKIRGLLTRGADVDSTDHQGKTALYWAAFKGNVPLVRLLLEHNADQSIRDSVRHQTPLEIARELALRGYREPNEDNLHAIIISLLKPDVEIKPQSPTTSSPAEVDGLAAQMSRLGIHANVPSPSPRPSAAKPQAFQPASNEKKEEERTCTLI